MLLTVAGYFGGTFLRTEARLRAARDAEQVGDFARARAELDRYLGDRPNDPAGRLLAARVGWRSLLGAEFPAGWQESARTHLKAAARAPELLEAVGVEEDVVTALADGPRRTEAALLRRIKSGHPDSLPILEALTRANLDVHQLANALEAVNGVLGRRPDHALGRYWRGTIVELAGRQSGEAGGDLRKAVELEPGNFEFRLRLATHLARSKEGLAEGRPCWNGWPPSAPIIPTCSWRWAAPASIRTTRRPPARRSNG